MTLSVAPAKLIGNLAAGPDAPVSFASVDLRGELAEVHFEASPQKPRLSGRCIHVWRVWLDKLAPQLEQFTQTLSPDELARARRYRFDRDRTRFIAGRGFLRMMLGSYTDTPPGHLRFSYGQRGKPELMFNSDDQVLHFNLAHSDGLALYAATLRGRIGIDVEKVRQIKEAGQILPGMFSEREIAQWRSFPAKQRQKEFYNMWTRKEACSKASGDGIADSPEQPQCSPPPPGAPDLPGDDANNMTASSWMLWSFVPEPHYVAAIATEATN